METMHCRANYFIAADLFKTLNCICFQIGKLEQDRLLQLANRFGEQLSGLNGLFNSKQPDPYQRVVK